MPKMGVCTVCQQTGIRVKPYIPTEAETEETRLAYKAGVIAWPYDFLLFDHDSSSGQRCQGSNQIPQAVYDT